jgi:hypothetical protein
MRYEERKGVPHAQGYAVMFDVLRQLLLVLSQIEPHDRDLGNQLRRASALAALTSEAREPFDVGLGAQLRAWEVPARAVRRVRLGGTRARTSTETDVKRLVAPPPEANEEAMAYVNPIRTAPRPEPRLRARRGPHRARRRRPLSGGSAQARWRAGTPIEAVRPSNSPMSARFPETRNSRS